MPEYQPDESLLILNGSVAAFSFLGEIFVLISYLVYKNQLRDPGIKLVLSLIIADLIGTLADFGYFFTNVNEASCIINGYIRLAALISSVVWVAAISNYSLKLIEAGEMTYWTYLFSSVVIPVVCCTIILFGNFTNWYAGYNFFVFGCTPSPGLALVVFYLPVLLTFVYIFFLYCKMKRFVDKVREKSETKSLMIYPLTLILCWMPALITRIWDVFENGNTPTFMLVLFIIGLRSIGFINGVFFGVQNRKIIRSKESIIKEETSTLDLQISLVS